MDWIGWSVRLLFATAAPIYWAFDIADRIRQADGSGFLVGRSEVFTWAIVFVSSFVWITLGRSDAPPSIRRGLQNYAGVATSAVLGSTGFGLLVVSNAFGGGWWASLWLTLGGALLFAAIIDRLLAVALNTRWDTMPSLQGDGPVAAQGQTDWRLPEAYH